MYSLISILGTLFVFAALIFIMVKLHQIASDLAIIARATIAQQGNQLPENQSASPAKPHNLAGFATKP